jgi:hypothetical protein
VILLPAAKGPRPGRAGRSPHLCHAADDIELYLQESLTLLAVTAESNLPFRVV